MRTAGKFKKNFKGKKTPYEINATPFKKTNKLHNFSFLGSSMFSFHISPTTTPKFNQPSYK
jgi:hypothetical protein